MSVWNPPAHWLPPARHWCLRTPAQVTGWLQETGSLTTRLVATAQGDFRVRVLAHLWRPAPQFCVGVGRFASVEDEHGDAAIGQELAQFDAVYQFGVAVVVGVLKEEKTMRLVRVAVDVRIHDFPTAHSLGAFRGGVGSVAVEMNDVVRLAVGVGGA